MTTDPSRRRFLRAVGTGGVALGAPGCLDRVDPTTDEWSVSSGDVDLDGEWPAFAADARNTGVAAAPGPTDPEVAWRFETTGTIYDSVAVANGAVFLGSTDGNVYALDAADGAERWRFPVRGQVRTTPAVAGPFVYVGGSRGGLYALEVASGRKRWSALESTEFSLSHPTVVDGTVYVGSTSGDLFAVDAATGDVEWRVGTGDYVATSPAVADGTVYVGWRRRGGPGTAGAGGLDAVTMDGERDWRIEPGQVDGSPTVVDGVVYASSSNAAHAFEAASGEELWRFEPAGNSGSPTVAHGLVFLGSMESSCYAVDAENGERVWEFTPGKWPNFAPVVAGDVVYLCSWATRVYGLDARTGEKLWRRSFSNPLSDPAVADGTVYVAPENTLLALRDE